MKLVILALASAAALALVPMADRSGNGQAGVSGGSPPTPASHEAAPKTDPRPKEGIGQRFKEVEAAVMLAQYQELRTKELEIGLLLELDDSLDEQQRAELTALAEKIGELADRLRSAGVANFD